MEKLAIIFQKISKTLQILNLPTLDQMYGEKSGLTNFDPKLAKFGPNFVKIWSLSNFQNYSQAFTCYDYQNLKYGRKILTQARIIQIIQLFSEKL